MNIVAPTDVTDPPEGWSWARSDIRFRMALSGETRWSVMQSTPSGVRVIEQLEISERDKLLRQWNDEAKAAA